ncbi:O-antigen ligase family protein [Xylophilus sp.]|uniref:O-antigen ligase family protein n=1 Tax=Xylophilus sp. TaxID=2653893 RepID=UPI002D80811C|nr:O-antigen ligase family protein [Xylophilus sp.]
MTEPKAPDAARRWDLRVMVVLVACSFAFALLPPGFDWSQIEAQGSYAGGSLAMQLEFGSLFLAGAWLALRNLESTLANLRRSNPFLLAFVAWCLLSVLWSPYPVVTLKRVVQLAGFTLVGIAVAAPLGGPRLLLRVLLAALTALLVASMVVTITHPLQGVDYELGGAWRGIMGQKNTLGAASGICALLWLRELLGERQLPWPIAAGGLLFALAMMVLAKSSTALLVTGLGMAAYLSLRWRGVALRRPAWVMALGAAAVLAAAAHFFYVVAGRLPAWSDLAGLVSAAFNKNADLTGRTDIWELVLMEVQRHPLQGIGYGAFWLGEGSRSQYVIDMLGWIPLQSHNGYLDILNEVGVVGLVLAAGALVWHAVAVARLLRAERELGALYAALLLMMLVSNTTESEMFRGVLFYNVLLFLLAAGVAASLRLHGGAGERRRAVA